jgi:hypothetical protein
MEDKSDYSILSNDLDETEDSIHQVINTSHEDYDLDSKREECSCEFFCFFLRKCSIACKSIVIFIIFIWAFIFIYLVLGVIGLTIAHLISDNFVLSLIFFIVFPILALLGFAILYVLCTGLFCFILGTKSFYINTLEEYKNEKK